MGQAIAKSPVVAGDLVEAFQEDTHAVCGSNNTTIDPETVQRVEHALKFIDADTDRDSWAKVAMAIKSEFGDDGIEIFGEWSEGGESFDFAALKSTWDSITGSGGITLGTLFHMAKQHPDYTEGKPLTKAQIKKWHADSQKREEERKQQQEAADKAQAEFHEMVAVRAATAWDDATEIDTEAGHAYLLKKRITGFGARIRNGNILVPMYHDGKLMSTQEIFPNGKKKFLKGGRANDCYMVIGEITDNVILCEGYATGCSLHKRTGDPVVVAFMCKSLMGVGHWIRETYPDAQVVIAADNDVATHKKTGKNPGIDAAAATAEALNCKYLYPDFSTCTFTGTDFNDFLEQGGSLDDAVVVDEFVNVQKPAIGIKLLPELLKPVGLIGEIAKYTESVMMRKQPIYAVASALIILATLTRGKYLVEALRTPLSCYFMLVGGSTVGKDIPRTVAMELLRGADMMENVLSTVASGPALLATLSRLDTRDVDLGNPTLLLLLDELGRVLAQAKGNQHASSFATDLMQLFGKGNTVYGGKTYTDEKKDIPPIDNPFVNVMATTTPETLTDAMSSKEVIDGYLNRFMLVMATDDCPPMAMRIQTSKPPQQLTDALNEIALLGAESGTIYIPYAPGVVKILEKFSAVCDSVSNTDKIGGLLGRAFQNSVAIAGILAVGDCK